MFNTFQGDSDKSIEALIDSYCTRTMREANASHKTDYFHIEPYIDIAYGNVNVGFRIGLDKLYVIKDLSKFALQFKTRATGEYGSSCFFEHDMLNLDEQSRLYAKFIISHCIGEKTSQYNYYTDRTVKKYIHMESYLYDELFAIFGANKLKLRYEEQNITANVVRGNPDITISLLKQTTGNFKLTIETDSLTHRPFVFKGGERTAVLSDNTIYLCDEKFSADVTDVLVALTNNWRGLNVSKNDIQIFSTSVLHQLKKHTHLKTDASTKDFEPLPLTKRLYLDIQSENYITGRLVFYYGNKKLDAFRQKNLSISTDLKGEYHAEALINKYFQAIDIEHNYAYIDGDEDAIFRLLNEGVDEIEETIEIYATDKFKRISVKQQPTISLGVKVNSNLLDLTFDLGDYDKDELIGLINAYRLNQHYFRLKNGSYLTLQDGSLKTFFELADGLNLTEKEILAKEAAVSTYRALYLDSLVKQDSRIKFDRDSGFKKIIRDIKYVSDSDFLVPPTLSGTLRSYQKVGYRWLKTISSYGFSGILADDMGLGKTVQVITLLLSEKLESKERKPSLVVCPSSLMLNWQSEIRRFAPTLESACVMGNMSSRQDTIENFKQYDILITSYDLLKRDAASYSLIEFNYLIIDEAQYIKNHTTQNAIAVKQINSKNRLALTGTPVENNLSELWSIYDFLMPNYLYSYKRFKRMFEVPIVKEKDETAVLALKRLVSPFILRRMKKDVLKELPPRVETTLYAPLEGKQQQLYAANIALIRDELMQESDVESVNKISVLAMLTRLRQICCTPELVYDGYDGESAKLDMCIELVENCIASNHKVLLFSQFTSMLKIIEQRLQQSGIDFYKITGSTKSEDRLDLVNAFNSDETPVFLISLKAGGTGLNLTGADVVIHFDPWWNVSAQNQATDRAHRMGQKNPVSIYKLIAKDTIEDKILEMQTKKSELANMIIDGTDGSIANMSKQDILSLFL